MEVETKMKVQKREKEEGKKKIKRVVAIGGERES